MKVANICILISILKTFHSILSLLSTTTIIITILFTMTYFHSYFNISINYWVKWLPSLLIISPQNYYQIFIKSNLYWKQLNMICNQLCNLGYNHSSESLTWILISQRWSFSKQTYRKNQNQRYTTMFYK